MSQRANLIKCKGLMTSGSELSLPEGALKKALNVNVDEEGVITPRRGFNDYGNATDEVTSKPIKQLFEYKDRLFRHFDTSLEFEDNTGIFRPISGSFNELREGYRIKFQEAKGNMYFTTEEGIKRISLKNNSTLTSTGTVSIEQAGVIKAAYMEGTATPTVGGFLPPQSKVAYRFLFGRKDANNNLLLGSASARHVISNTSAETVQYQTTDITVNNAATIVDAEYIVISSLDYKFTLYFKTTGAAVNPPYNSNTFGTQFILVDISTAGGNNATVAAIIANAIASNISQYDVTLSTNVVTFTSNEKGTPATNVYSVTGISETAFTAGSVVAGDSATCDLTLILPSNVTTDYFVQVYRTAVITASEGLTLDDVDPGDECNIVYEKSITAPDITAGEFTFNDNTPESFRASGVPLYTNEITGEGVLQSNDPPPIALDIALFRNSMFYANTKSAHRVEFDILSVDNFVNDFTRIVVGNSVITRYYTAAAAELADTPEGGEFKLSTSLSVSIAIDETARSLVKIINQDSLSPVNAFYLTGSDDLPGQLLFEARDLSDDTLYIGVEEPSDPLIGEEFSPEIPLSKPMERLRGNTSNAIITLTGHGFSTGDQKYISFLSDGDVDAPSSISGVYTITKLNDDEFTIEIPMLPSVDSNSGTHPFTVQDSAIYDLDLASDNLEIPNRIYFSKPSEPEAVPIANYIDVGAKDAEIKRILALRDNLFVLKDDGVFIVSGTSAPDFSVRLLDNTRIVAPDSAVVLNNQIFALTEQGITIITDSGVGVISRGIENLVDEIVNADYDYIPNTFGVAYENDRAYIMFAPSASTDESATQAFRYNIFQRTWTRWEYPATCGLVAERDTTLYLGNGSRNYVSKERKNYDRTDHSERNFTIQISADGVNGTELKVSNTDDIEVNDVFVQTQSVSLNYVNNRILKKMDYFDNGITAPIGSTMYDSFKVTAGDDIKEKLLDLNAYLISIDPSITVKAFSTGSYLEDTNTLIDELNDIASVTLVKDYQKPRSVDFEAYITNIDKVTNIITVHTERPFLQQDIEVYKHIQKRVQWSPQHFGDPSAVKQIREVTILFDQNNFYDAIAKFGSDVAQSLTSQPFKGKGIGYWGDMEWGDPDHYWGGDGNDVPFRTNVPRDKQKCRYLTLVFEHRNAREDFRILGITGVVRPISSRGYK